MLKTKQQLENEIHLLREKVRIAIARIHHMAEYFGGMDLLCEIAGYHSLNHWQDEMERRRTSKKFDAWVIEKGAGFMRPAEPKKRKRGRPRKVA